MRASDAWGAGKGKEEWQSEQLMAMVRELQPGIILNDRLDIPGDLKTPSSSSRAAGWRWTASASCGRPARR